MLVSIFDGEYFFNVLLGLLDHQPAEGRDALSTKRKFFINGEAIDSNLSATFHVPLVKKKWFWENNIYNLSIQSLECISIIKWSSAFQKFKQEINPPEIFQGMAVSHSVLLWIRRQNWRWSSERAACHQAPAFWTDQFRSSGLVLLWNLSGLVLLLASSSPSSSSSPSGS